MSTSSSRVHKHFQLDSVKIKGAQKVLRAKTETETETVERALDFTIAELEKIGCFSRPMSVSSGAAVR